MNAPDSRSENVAKAIVNATKPQDLEALRLWAQRMLAIRGSDLSAAQKANSALRASMDRKVLSPILHVAWRELRRVGWEERGLPARLALASAAAALTLSGQGAGIAALGGAVGVPLFVVFGAGGALAGVIIDEIRKKKP